MDIVAIIGAAWRITWRNWALWAMALAMLLAFIPLSLLTFAFSEAASLAAYEDPGSAALLGALPGGEQLQRWLAAAPAWQWLALGLAALAGLVAATVLTLFTQAASMRGVLAAADGGRAALRPMLALGWTRARRLGGLSLAAGLVIAVLSLAPSAGLAWLGAGTPLGAVLARLTQTGLTPLTALLNFGALLLAMSIALEDYSPRAAFGRAGNVFRQGWWAFVLVAGISSVAAMITALIVVIPAVFAAPFMVFNMETGLMTLAGSLICGGLAALLFFIFTVVFTQALYALVYREAARRTAAPA